MPAITELLEAACLTVVVLSFSCIFVMLLYLLIWLLVTSYGWIVAFVAVCLFVIVFPYVWKARRKLWDY